MLKILLSIALGLGLAGQAAFYSHIVFNAHDRFLPMVLAAGLIFACHHFAFTIIF